MPQGSYWDQPVGEFKLENLKPAIAKPEIEQYMYRFYQVTPDRNFKNDNNNIITRAIHDMYQTPLKRVNKHNLEGRLKFKYTPQPNFIFRILMTHDKICFYIGVPIYNNWDDYLIKKCKNTWIKSSIKPTSGDVFDIRFDRTQVAELKYKRHHIFSITTDKRGMDFYDTLLSNSQYLDHGEKILITYVIQPENRRDWQDKAQEAYGKFKRGIMPRKFELDKRAVFVNVLRVGEAVMDGAKEFIEGLLIDNSPKSYDEFFNRMFGNDPPTREMVKEGEVSDLLVNGRLSNATTKKISDYPFKVKIFICSQCKNGEAMNRSIANAFSLLSEDNELVLKEMGRKGQFKTYETMERMELGFDINTNIMSLEEVSKLISLPTVSIQERYPKMHQISQKEVELPSELFDSRGIPFCTISDRGDTRQVYSECRDINILCQSHIDLGIKGSGKTTHGMNYALNWISKLRYSAFAVDVADGKLIDSIRDGLPTWFPDDHIIDLDLGNGDWPIALTLSEMATANLEGYRARQAANKWTQAILDFVTGVSKNDTTDRMERYLTAVSKATLYRPENSLLDIFLGLTSRKYRTELIAQVKDENVKQQLKDLNSFTAEQTKQIVQPIMDRLNMLTNDSMMQNCLLQSAKLDEMGKPVMNFRKWADGDGLPYFVGIRVPKEELMPVTTDRLVTFLIYKYWLAILTRYNVEEEQRRPTLLIMDEPHQFLSCKMVWEQMAREDRKWRSKSIFLAHNYRDFGDLTKTFQDVGMQYSIYKSSKQTYKDIIEELSPFTLEDLMAIPDRFYAVNKIRGPKGSIPAFLGYMGDPPSKVKDRSYRRLECSKQYGNYVESVEKQIYTRRKLVGE